MKKSRPKDSSYMELCIHLDGKENVYLRIPTVWDDIKKQWIGFIKTPVTQRLIHAEGKDSFELQNNFNHSLNKIFQEGGEVADEVFGMFMGNKEECPCCRSCTSEIYNALNYTNSNCPYCSCPHELLVKWSYMQPEIENLKKTNLEKKIIKQIEDLETENAMLKTKISRMYDILAWRDIEDLFDPFIKVKKILEE